MKKNYLLFISLLFSICANAQWENTFGPKADDVKYAGNCVSILPFQNSLISAFPYSGTYVSDVVNDTFWNETNQGLKTLQIVRLFNEGTNVYATTRQGLFVNKNILGNQNWENITYNLPSLNSSITSIAIAGDFKMVSTDILGVFTNNNNENFWKESRKGLLDNNIKKVFFENDTFFSLTANDGLYFSADSGKLWKMYGQVSCLACTDVLKKNENIWIVENQLVKQYKNGFFIVEKHIKGAKGLHWNNDTLYVFSNAVNKIYFSSNTSVFDSLQISFAPDVFVDDIAFANNNLYLATTNYGILKYDFQTWKSFNKNLKTAFCNQIYTTQNTLFSKAYREIFKYQNQQWKSTYNNVFGMNEVNEMAIDSDYIWVATKTNGVMRSADAGLSWQKIGTIENNISRIHVSNKNNILAFANNKCYRLNKQTNVWESYFNMAPDIQINCAYEWGDTLLSGTENGLYISYNNGSAFNKIPGIKSNPVNYIFKNRDVIWAKVGGELYITNDILNFTSWYIYFYDLYPNFPLSDYHSFTPKGEFIHTTSGIIYRPKNDNFWNFQPSIELRTIHQFAEFQDTLFAATSSSIFYLPSKKITTNIDKRLQKNKVLIYPNPAKDEIKIECEKEIKSVLFIDALGKTIQKNTIQNNTDNIDVSNLPNGIYYIKILDKEKNEIEIIKLIKQ